MTITSRLAALLAFAALSACDMAPSDISFTDVAVTAPTPEPRSRDEEAGGFATEIVEPAIVVTESSPAPTTGSGLVRAGVLTAGDIDDALNPGAFTAYLRNVAGAPARVVTNFSNGALVQVLSGPAQAASGIRYTLSAPGRSNPLFEGYTGVGGFISVFPSRSTFPGRNLTLRLFPTDGPVSEHQIATGPTRQTIMLDGAGPEAPDFLDLVFVVDTTGSMADELDWLTRDLNRIVRNATRGTGVDVRYGLIVYRDIGDDYVVRRYEFTDSGRVMRAQLRAQYAAGGGDYPEAAADALQAALDLPWRRGQGERLLFHIADAPPHDRDAARYLALSRQAAERNIQIFGLGASGVADEAEFLMRQAAAVSGGRYMFLTDDSGVGNAHAEPTISCYVVTRLSDLMTRVIRSELTGVRQEAPGSEVIRRVGTYAQGVCLN